eukprot:TRINITY_DN17259_c0_g1_i1.p3 TRINITY_DN17259_c0_g1~~TRINITY_DN17259_c0_g1_i1.p3  ORF type:complete len:53 (+),score=5.99 TRINITY_DN17259_c0_g1_i1:344-502(+)
MFRYFYRATFPHYFCPLSCVHNSVHVAHRLTPWPPPPTTQTQPRPKIYNRRS